MRKLLAITVALLFSVCLCAQNQQAIVKTRGKLDDNGNVIPGRGLSGAFVKIKGGNTHESKAEGLLSFPVPEGKYSIEKVTYVDNTSHERYQLVDMDEMGRFFNYSTTPKDILVATQYEINEDRLYEEMRAREVLMKNYRKRQEEIKQLQAANQISREEAQRLRQQLVDAQANEEKLVSDMAERYAKIDFDRMGDFDRQFAHFIRSGQLVSADSLLRTQGDVSAMEDTLRMIRKENVAGRKIIANKKVALARDEAVQAQNEEYEEQLLEKIADNYYKRYEIFSQQFMHDSAAFYLDRRALLDTTRVEWQFDMGLYYQNQNQFHKVEPYYVRALRLYRQSGNEPDVAVTLNNLANIYFDTQRFEESEAMYKEALEIRRRLAEANPQVYNPAVAQSLQNLSNLYQTTQRFAESASLSKEALDIESQFTDTCQMDGMKLYNEAANLVQHAMQYNQIADIEEAFNKMLSGTRLLVKNDPKTYEPILANHLNTVAYYYLEYYDNQRLAESEALLNETLEIYGKLAETNPQAYEPNVAMTLNNLANIYSDTQRFEESEAMYKKVLEIQKRLAETNPQVYTPVVAMTLNNLAILYRHTQRFAESETMSKEVLEIRRRLAEANPQVYEPDLAQALYNLGILWANMEKYDQAIQSLEEGVTIYRKVVQKNRNHRYGYEGTLYYLGGLYSETQNHNASYYIYNELLPLLKENYQEDPEKHKAEYSSCLGGVSFQSIFLSKFTEAEQYASEGLEIDDTQTWIHANLAASLLFQGKYKKAEKIYSQYKDEFKEDFLNDLAAYENSGIIPEKYKDNVEKIKLMLHE